MVSDGNGTSGGPELLPIPAEGPVSYANAVARAAPSVVNVNTVVTRRNQRTLRTDSGIMVKNRDHWTIEHIHGDGAVTVTGRTGTVRLAADQPWMAEIAHTNLGGLFVRAPLAVRWLLGNPAAVPRNIPGRLEQAGLVQFQEFLVLF